MFKSMLVAGIAVLLCSGAAFGQCTCSSRSSGFSIHAWRDRGPYQVAPNWNGYIPGNFSRYDISPRFAGERATLCGQRRAPQVFVEVHNILPSPQGYENYYIPQSSGFRSELPYFAPQGRLDCPSGVCPLR